jgi:hypothetical protein
LGLPEENGERDAKMAGRRLRWRRVEEAGAAERKVAADAVAVAAEDIMVAAIWRCFSRLCLSNPVSGLGNWKPVVFGW